MSRNKRGKKRAVVAMYGTPEAVVRLSVTIHKKGSAPYEKQFDRKPTDVDSRRMTSEAINWARLQGVDFIEILKTPYTVADTVCRCCGELLCVKAHL